MVPRTLALPVDYPVSAGGWFGAPRTNSVGYHLGQDRLSPYGTPVRFAQKGEPVLIRTGSFPGDTSAGGYGIHLIGWHPNGNYGTLYAHLARCIVSVGQQLVRGQIIGYSDNTGYSTGNHHHHEVIDGYRKGDGYASPYSRVNPQLYYGKEVTLPVVPNLTQKQVEAIQRSTILATIVQKINTAVQDNVEPDLSDFEKEVLKQIIADW